MLSPPTPSQLDQLALLAARLASAAPQEQARLDRLKLRTVMICTPIARAPVWRYTLALAETCVLLSRLGIRFYYNTVIVENAPASSGFQFGIFDMPTSQQSVDVADNIIAFLNNGAGNTMGLGICCGTINLIDANWITSGYATGASGNTITLNKPGTVLTGANPLLNADFTLSATSGSPVLGQATLYPTSVPNAPADVTTLQPTDEYANTVIGVVPRPNDNDLGAYAAH